MIEHRERTVNNVTYCIDAMLFDGSCESLREAIMFQYFCKEHDFDIDFIVNKSITGRQVLTLVYTGYTKSSKQNFPPCILALFYYSYGKRSRQVFHCRNHDTKKWKLELTDMFIDDIQEAEIIRCERSQPKSLLSRIRHFLIGEW